MVYSFTHSLNDQSPEIQEKAWMLWDKAGTQWGQENEDDIKDKVDYLDMKPDHYPTDCKEETIPSLSLNVIIIL